MRLEVTSATPEEVAYVMDLQRKNRESVGGLPQAAIEERLQRGTCLLGKLNDDPVGYLLYDLRDGVLRIPQACIQYDARRRTYGEQLVRRLPEADEVRLRCAADLEANLFWADMGFTCVGQVPGGKRRGRVINIWQRWNDQRLFGADGIATAPASQRRVDCYDEQTSFIEDAPEGFVDLGALPKLAWSNRK